MSSICDSDSTKRNTNSKKNFLRKTTMDESLPSIYLSDSANPINKYMLRKKTPDHNFKKDTTVSLYLSLAFVTTSEVISTTHHVISFRYDLL